MYKCGWNGCEKAYGTLNHLNAHVTMQSHGQKRTPEGMIDFVLLYTVFPTSIVAIHYTKKSRASAVRGSLATFYSVASTCRHRGCLEVYLRLRLSLFGVSC